MNTLPTPYQHPINTQSTPNEPKTITGEKHTNNHIKIIHFEKLKKNLEFVG